MKGILLPASPAMALGGGVSPCERERFHLYPRGRSFEKFHIHKTTTRFYIFGSNKASTYYRLLKLDRTEGEELTIVVDPAEYSRAQYKALLMTISEGNKKTGGLRHLMDACAIMGLVRFLEGYYVILVTKRRKVGEIGGHNIYGVERVSYLSVVNMQLVDKPTYKTHKAEDRYLTTMFSGIDFTKDFYFSYTYDLTRSLSHNMAGPLRDFNDMFLWNHYLLKNLLPLVDTEWVVPLINGFFQQQRFSFLGRIINLLLLARRSRLFAGTRYLKRGVSEEGDVANEVETEQILYEDSSGIGHEHYTSIVVLRGSIPVFWTNDSYTSPRPGIVLVRPDPLCMASCLHFAKLMKRYGTPIIAFNLVKQHEKTPKETILAVEFARAVRTLNAFITPKHQIRYHAFDLLHAAKDPKAKALDQLMELAKEFLRQTGFFDSGIRRRDPGLEHRSARQRIQDSLVVSGEQHGVLRVNCIDCLDRTNLAQLCYGRQAAAYQLFALGVIPSPQLDHESKIITDLSKMYVCMGDSLASQYGGSQALHKASLSASSWAGKPSLKDAVISVKRYYSNAFTDSDKQDAINLLLGYFVPDPGKPHLWELESDQSLHLGNESHFSVDITDPSWWMNALQEYQAKTTHVDDVVLADTHQDFCHEEYYQQHKITSFDKMAQRLFMLRTEIEPATETAFAEADTLKKVWRQRLEKGRKWLQKFGGKEEGVGPAILEDPEEPPPAVGEKDAERPPFLRRRHSWHSTDDVFKGQFSSSAPLAGHRMRHTRDWSNFDLHPALGTKDRQFYSRYVDVDLLVALDFLHPEYHPCFNEYSHHSAALLGDTQTLREGDDNGDTDKKAMGAQTAREPRDPKNATFVDQKVFDFLKDEIRRLKHNNELLESQLYTARVLQKDNLLLMKERSMRYEKELNELRSKLGKRPVEFTKTVSSPSVLRRRSSFERGPSSGGLGSARTAVKPSPETRSKRKK